MELTSTSQEKKEKHVSLTLFRILSTEGVVVSFLCLRLEGLKNFCSYQVSFIVVLCFFPKFTVKTYYMFRQVFLQFPHLTRFNFFSDDYWSNHPELHDIPIYYASSLAKKCMAVYQTYSNAMNQKIQKQLNVSNPFQFKHISNLKVRLFLDLLTFY